MPFKTTMEMMGTTTLRSDVHIPCFSVNQFYERHSYPRGTPARYFSFGSPIIGGVIGSDTIAYIGLTNLEGFPELVPDESPFGDIVYRTTVDTKNPYFNEAISQQDFIVHLTDTLRTQTRDPVTLRFNKRLGMNVTYRSYAWSYRYAEDFIIIDMTVTNTTQKMWQGVYVGWFGDIFAGVPNVSDGSYDDMVGFRETYSSPLTCNFLDTVNIMWAADNNGGPINGSFAQNSYYIPNVGWSISPTGVAGIKFLTQFQSQQRLQFNWFGSKFTPPQFELFNPQERSSFRDFKADNPFPGWPVGNRNGYHAMSNGEIDFDQAYTAYIDRNNPTWTYQYGHAIDSVAMGAHSSEMLTYGPFTVEPGASIDFAFAIVMGENFHHDPHNFENNMPHNPRTYLDNLDFSDLVKNATWAQWIYDNPGVDTDGDGYFGESRICVTDSSFVDGAWIPVASDTQWYRGDGIPDWKAASPPPAPYVWVTPTLNGLNVRFNGERTETEKDIFTQIPDFEGYRVYWGRDERRTSLATIATYDKENYDKWVFISSVDDSGFITGRYEIRDVPQTVEQLRCLYGSGIDPCDDSTFDPLDYPNYQPLQWGDSTFYFSQHDYNTSELGVTTPITKTYPAARDPRGIPTDQLTDDDYTKDGHLKFFEYEMKIKNLLPTVPYWVNVTAFDFGSPISGLEALETSPTLNIKQAFAASSEAEVAGDTLKVYVYPNPYRIDDNYRSEGYEGRTRDDFPNDKVRQLNFANLPYKCTIRIYTLDGDLVVEKKHDTDPSDPTGRHDYWSLINRNRQIIVSGLYYWTVEDESGNVQMGKFMVIR